MVTTTEQPLVIAEGQVWAASYASAPGDTFKFRIVGKGDGPYPWVGIKVWFHNKNRVVLYEGQPCVLMFDRYGRSSETYYEDANEWQLLKVLR